jgi:chromate transporter
MIFLQLFFTFFKIGLFTFGGGYGAIPLVENEVISAGWLSEEEILTFIGISEATPGPFAINIATFVGSSQGGFLGALCATIGFVMPSFLIIIIVAIILSLFMKSKIVKGALKGIMPVVIGLIFASGIIIILRNFNLFSYNNNQFDYISVGIVGTLFIIYLVYKKTMRKSLNPIVLILLAAVLGMVAYAI